MAGLALFDVLEVHLGELAGIGVDRRAGEGEVERRLALGRVAVTGELQVELRADGGRAFVEDLMLHTHHVVTTLEGVGLHQASAVDGRGLQLQLDLCRAIGQGPLGGQHLHRRQVVGQLNARLAGNEARLGQVEPLRALVEEQHVARRVVLVGVLEQLQAHEAAAHRVDGGLDHIGGDGHLLGGHDGRVGHGCRCGGSANHIGSSRHTSGGRRSSRRGQSSGHAGCCGRLSRRCRGHRLADRGTKDGGLTGVLVPGVPQQHQRHRENHPQQGAAHIGHGEGS